MAEPRASTRVRPHHLAAPVLALGLLFSGCVALGGEEDAPPVVEDDAPQGPRFLLVVENGVNRTAIVHLRVTGPQGGLDVEGNVSAPAERATNETIPLARDGAQRLDMTYSLSGGGYVTSGESAAIFDSAECTGLVRVTLRLTAHADGNVYGGASSVCDPSA